MLILEAICQPYMVYGIITWCSCMSGSVHLTLATFSWFIGQCPVFQGLVCFLDVTNVQAKGEIYLVTVHVRLVRFIWPSPHLHESLIIVFNFDSIMIVNQLWNLSSHYLPKLDSIWNASDCPDYRQKLGPLKNIFTKLA